MLTTISYIILSTRAPFYLFFTSLLTLLFITYLHPSEAFYDVHDYLDAFFVFLAQRAEIPDLFWNLNARMERPLGGISLNAVGINDFGIGQNLFLWFDPFTAQAIAELTSRVIGFVGTFLFVSRHVIPPHARSGSVFIASLSALMFAIAPHYPAFYATVTMVPLLAFAVANIWSGKHRQTDFAIIGAYPFFSYFIFGGFAVTGVLLWVATIAFVLRNKSALILALTGLYLLLAYCLMEYRLIVDLLFSTTPSIRSEFIHPEYSGLPAILSSAWGVFLHGQRHFKGVLYGFSAYFVYTTSIFFFAAALARRYGVRFLPELPSRSLLWAILSIGLAALCSIVYAMDNNGLFNLKYDIGLPFQFNRIIVWVPFLWAVAFASTLSLATSWFPGIRVLLLVGIAVLSLQGTWAHIDGIHPKLGLLSCRMSGNGECSKWLDPMRPAAQVSIRAYFRQKTYEKLAGAIGKPQDQYRVVSVGLSPMTAVFNGFFTLDGYLTNYPLSHKAAFRKIISGELEKDDRLMRYFDTWGGRARLFIADPDSWAGFRSIQRPNAGPVDLAIDTCQIWFMGGEYIFSRYLLVNAEELNLDLKGILDDIFLYEIRPDSC
ncbi:MAG: DUF6044 family protein [Nitrospirota bacterium]|nr:DUF6044 family protein [Nitrospirota bacterium]